MFRLLLFSAPLFWMACQWGRPPASLSSLSIELTSVQSFELGVKDLIQDELSRELLSRGLGYGHPKAELSLEECRERMLFPDGEDQVWELKLRFRLFLSDKKESEVVVSGRERYLVNAGDSLGSAGSRQAAYRRLAASLIAQAIDRLLYSSTSESRSQ